jgi:CspA family cold shock protein
MNFRDRWAENEQGERFVFTVEMQRRLSQAGLPIDPSALAQLPPAPAAARPPRVEYQEREERPDRGERPERRDREERREQPSQSSSSGGRPREAEIVGPETIQIDPQTGKYIGRVKWYNTKKGYGFIVRGAGEEIFFHKSATVGEMEEFEEGQWVLYDVETTNKGPEASDVEPYTGEPVE